MPIASMHLDSWESIATYSQTRWIFRGQKERNWNLRTSLERCFARQHIEPRAMEEVERDLIREFKRTYHNYATQVPVDSAILEWLSLMQHHGAPTRLLDFSYSTYVAAYFALEESESEAAIWAVNQDWVQDEAVRILTAAGKMDAENLNKKVTPHFETIIEPLFYQRPLVPCVCIVNPFRLSDRLRMQKGVFLVQGDPTLPFQDNLQAMRGHDDSRNVKQIIIPATMRKAAIEKLYYMNITRTNLFPGLDGFAQSLGVFHPVFPTTV